MSARKYGQRGYMEEGRDEARERRPAGRPRERDPGPRGRGLGKPTATVFRCAVCGREHGPGDVGLDSACAGCGADLHTCTHCAWFDTGAINECMKDVEERIAGKAKRNRCELFTAKATREFAKETSSPNSARAAFDALFKD